MKYFPLFIHVLVTGALAGTCAAMSHDARYTHSILLGTLSGLTFALIFMVVYRMKDDWFW